MRKMCQACRQGYCALAYANRRQRENNKGHRYYRASGLGDIEGLACMAMKKPTSTAPTRLGSSEDHCAFSSKHPMLWEWMTEEKWDDSSRRLLPSLTVFVEDGSLKVCLNDKALQRVCFVSVRSVDAIWMEIEEGLTLDSLDWRKSKGQSQRK